MSLEQSEGSVLSEDALDTEDDGLDTGDDLDVSIAELDTPDEAGLPGRFTNRTCTLTLYHQKHISPPRNCDESLFMFSCCKQLSQRNRDWGQM